MGCCAPLEHGGVHTTSHGESGSFCKLGDGLDAGGFEVPFAHAALAVSVLHPPTNTVSVVGMAAHPKADLALVRLVGGVVVRRDVRLAINA